MSGRTFQELRPEVVINCASNQGGIGFQSLYPATMFYDNLLMGVYTMEAARLGPIGQELMFNFIQLQPYTAPTEE